MTQRARRRQRRRPRGSVGKKVLLGVGIVAVVAGIGLAAAAAWVVSIYDSAPALGELKPIKKGTITQVYAADGTRIGVIHADNIRQPVPGSKIPRDLKDATVAIEDRNFYSHGGIDPQAIVRAGIADVLAGGKPVQGGSTITQQLVRNLYIANPQETIKRKIVEAHLANDEEAAHSKGWILTKYLNTAPYGTNNGATAIGVEAAAETYFSKHASELTLGEAAMIAGLPQAPSQYNPFLNPRAALARRNEVLQAMEQQGYISPREYSSAVKTGLGLDPSQKYNRITQPYIFDLVKQELVDKYGLNTVENGGLKVYTTIQPQLQAAAQRAVDGCSVCYTGGGPASALASVDPQTGEIVALASTQRFSQDTQFNFAAQAHRQPGSSFKTYVLTTAIKDGADPNATFYNGSSPKTLQIPGGGTWDVANAEPGGGTYDLTQATWDSVNVVFAQLGLDVGPENFAKTAYSMGITSPLGIKSDQSPCKLGPNCFIPPADAIGGLSVGVTPLEMADAYATLADGGVHHDATAIAKVVFPDGKTDTASASDGNRVLTPGQAYEVTKILEGVITSGTGTGYTEISGCPSDGQAGKTGTSQGLSDAWFVGYTTNYSTAVWTGHPLSRAYTGFGGPTSGPIWRSYMDAATGGSCTPFPVPSSLPSLSAYYGQYTVSGSSSKSSYSTSGYTSTSTTPSTTPTVPTGGTGGTGGNYSPRLYAPGAGQQPLPTPGGGTGGGGGGGP
jgi:penicillin-binding protein 1A